KAFASDGLNVFNSEGWQNLRIETKLNELRVGLAPGGPIYDRLHREPIPSSEEVKKLFLELIPLTEAMEDAEKNPATAPKTLREHVVNAEKIPNLLKLTLPIRPDVKTEDDRVANIGNAYVTEYKGRHYLVTAKHMVVGTHAEKLFVHASSETIDPDIVVMAIADPEYLPDKSVIAGPDAY